MRKIIKALAFLFFLTPVLVLALVWFALSPQPSVTARTELSAADVDRAKAVLKASDPRGKAAGSEQRIALRERDLNVALDYAFRKYGRGAARVEVTAQGLRAVGSLPLPYVPLRQHINIETVVESNNGAPRIASLRIGALPVPAFLAGGVLRVVAESAFGVTELTAAALALRDLRFAPGLVTVRYQWQPETVRVLGTQLAGVHPDALQAYHVRLRELQAGGVIRGGSLAPALAPLFTLARERSAHATPASENRALLIVLGAWASDRGTRRLLPRAAPEPEPLRLTLHGRRDLAQHFLVSAALAAASETRVSDAIGLHKELTDARGGSGFSFVDLVADRAGTRFGELASATDAGAKRVQERLGRVVAEGDIMPAALDLPEGLAEAEFRRRYQNADSPEYRRLAEEIERRVSGCGLYRS